MDLPAGLKVTPADSEYQQVVNYWKTISKNNTLDEVKSLLMSTPVEVKPCLLVEPEKCTEKRCTGVRNDFSKLPNVGVSIINS